MNATTPSVPNFAYPKKVSAHAQSELAVAIKNGDNPTITQSLINIYLAETKINPDSAQSAIEKISQICDESSEPTLRSILSLLQAEIYLAYYNNNRYVYDRRKLPLTPLSANIDEWSGDQFKDRITSLIDAAIKEEVSLKATPISSYFPAITFDNTNSPAIHAAKNNLVYYPTLFDFVATKAISIFSNFSNRSLYLSFGLLCRFDEYISYPFNSTDPYLTRILELYASLLNFHEGEAAPFIHFDIERINFVRSHIYDFGNDNSFSSSEQKKKLLIQLYEDNKDSEYSGNVLIALFASNSHSVQYDYTGKELNFQKWLYDAIERNIKVFPKFARVGFLKDIRSDISRQSIKIKGKSVYGPGMESTFDMDLVNITDAKIYIYDVSDSPIDDDYYSCKGLPAKKVLAIIPIKSTTNEIPFCEKQTFSFTFPKVGQYIAIPTFDSDNLSDKKYYEKIRITELSIATSSFGNDNIAWGVNALTGNPVYDASVLYSERRKSIKQIGKTDGDGSFSLNNIKNSGTLFISKGADKYAPSVSWYKSSDNTIECWNNNGKGFTSLALYRPGDTVEWVAMLYSYLADNHKPTAQTKVKATFYNASRVVIDTLEVVTDDFGRAAGSFKIPEGSMTGQFLISIEDYSTSIPVTVSDYKLPTFQLILEPVETNLPAKGAATLRGKAVSYSGFPINNADLSVKLSAIQPFFYWGRGPIDFYDFNVKTDLDGKFEIPISADILRLSPLPGGVFNIVVNATSSTGETQTASTSFAMQSQYRIVISAPDDVDISEPTSAIKFEAENYRGEKVNIPLNYSFLKGEDVVLAGSLKPDQTKLDLHSLPSGEYTLKITTADEGLAATQTKTVVLYRPTDTTTPVSDKLLWHADTRLKIKPGEDEASWLYAVNCPTYILLTLHSDTAIISRKWINVNEGMHLLPVALPEEIEAATLEVCLTSNYHKANVSIDIEREIVKPGIKFLTESFRNHLIPGEEETWSFRVVDESGEGAKSAVILDMYNKALDALSTQRWHFIPATNTLSYHYSWHQSSVSAYFATESHSSDNRSTYNNINLFYPDFNTYGHPLYVRRYIAYDALPMASMSLSKSSNLCLNLTRAFEDHDKVADEDTVVNESVSYSTTADAGGFEVSTTDESENENINETAAAKFEYRDREMPLAFFRPNLTTDDEGRLSFSFTVPNANTTWGFRAVAFTDSLLSTSFAEDVVANKPIMVQPNLPRFLRSGDKATVMASVMNNSDEKQSVTTRIEIFSASDGKMVKEYTQTDSIEAGRSATVSVDIDAPDAPFIGYRIKSSTDRFADGEQTLLPVLPASSPVFETYPFYIAPDEREFEMTIPQTSADARTTLQYCDNPIWYVVTALPGILDREAKTANEAAASLFSASIASGLLRDNPQIAKAIEDWNKSDRNDETLTSMLEKNADLKQVLLSATPWMLDAKSDTERMARLALLFDKATVEGTISANIAQLQRLLCDDGGWSWFDSYKEPSMWATENVLMLLGDLLKLGYLIDSPELRDMIRNSFTWLDRKYKERYLEYPTADFTLYILLKDRFANYPGVKPPKKEILSATISHIRKHWSDSSAPIKAIYAQILANHSQIGMAKDILQSLREFASYSPQKGEWWPSLDDHTLWSMGKISGTAVILDAFAEIEPQCEDIDRIRQWLILQKETKDWGTSVTTSQAIASILSTSKTWLKEAGESKISIGKTKIEPSNVEKYTGYFRTPVSLKSGKESTLTVKRSSDSPAWGAVFVQSVQKMDAVKSVGCDELTIEKSLVVNSTDNDGKPSALYADSLTVAERISVTLTIRVGQDLDYVTIVDERPACFEPVDQLSSAIYSEGICFYRENRDSETRLFIDHLPKGTYVLTYDVWVNNAGTFASGIATVQSQYAPRFTAHSAGRALTVRPR